MKVTLDLTERLRKTKADIAKERDELFVAGFTYQGDGLKYPCDIVLQEAVKSYLIDYAVGISDPTELARIRRWDNSFWYPSYEELKQFAGALKIHVESIWTEYWAKKDNLPEITNG